MTKLSQRVTQFAIRRSGLVSRGLLAITLLLVVVAGLPSLLPDSLGFMPQVKIDTDPESMLPADNPERLFHNESKEEFQLHDAVVLGIVNEKHTNGVFNVRTLNKVYKLTEFAKGLEGVIVSDIMAPSTMDSIENAGPGTVKFDWLMPEPPRTMKEALSIRDRALRIPFLKDTLVSGDGRALLIYIPIVDKDEAHEISTALSEEIERIGAGDDQFHIAGLPVAEDTFGIEMFIQMAISAPMAMIVIFFLMWLYFRNLTIITSPMLVAMAAALITMALLILTGNTIHIMSSMIPIFIMPIAVLDAVHIISDFFDTYPKTGDRQKTIEEVMDHLFSPMLFTSLTTAAGFASLAFTPIPPVQVFGIFIAIGVIIAWLCTIIFVPAYLMRIAPKRLEGFGRKIEKESKGGLLAYIGRMGPMQAKLVLLVAVGLVAVAVIGIQKIKVNDNPTKWFEEDHPIRVADTVLNEHFGGTYDAYLRLKLKRDAYSPAAQHKEVEDAVRAQIKGNKEVFAELSKAIDAQVGKPVFDALDALDVLVRKNKRTDPSQIRRVAWGYSEDFLGYEFEAAEEADEAADEAKSEVVEPKPGNDAAAPAVSAPEEAQVSADMSKRAHKR
ncbi:MAG: MMPL family transporter, partial [Kofleriaceae bacterium]|nr:MMPL family transporter [Kofleriaceae bacterium]